jgi:dGTPase
LNLSREVLEGQSTRAVRGEELSQPIAEVQVVEAADSVTYDTHDADDALELGLLSLDELLERPLWAEAARRVRARWADLDRSELRRAVLHELIDWQVGDLLTQATARIAAFGVDSPQAVRASEPIVVASAELVEQKRDLESFLRERVYLDSGVLEHRREAQAMLAAMFAGYLANPSLLPENAKRRIPLHGLPRTVADYLAGMTDRFTQREFARLFRQS